MTSSAKSTLHSSNLQEMIDATTNAGHTARVGQAQYFTPPWFARLMASLCPGHVHTVFDPQAGRADLLNGFLGSVERIGVEIDNRLHTAEAEPTSGDITVRRPKIATGNCVRFFELWQELFPNLNIPHVVANPPFSLKFKTADGPTDSTLWTWQTQLALAGPNGTGYMIANADTIERLGLNKAPQAWLYMRFANGIFPEANVEIGVLHFHGGHLTGPSVRTFLRSRTQQEVINAVNMSVGRNHCPLTHTYGGMPAELLVAFTAICEIMAEEKRNIPPFNIWLRPNHTLGTYLSTHEKLKRGLTPKEIARLANIDRSHPLALTPEKETRELLRELIDQGAYTIEPAAKNAIRDALEESAVAAVPIMPVTDFQRVAYCDEEEALTARADLKLDLSDAFCPNLTPGQNYPLTTSTYEFVNSYQRKKLHMGGGETYAADHNLTLTGQDRFIEIVDNAGTRFRFMDRPSTNSQGHVELSDADLWRFFNKPEVPTVSDKFPEAVAQNLSILDAIELMSGFTYYEGQRPYLARVATRDFALIGAETGTGKSLMCISLVVLKAPRRALIVAPQGTTRAAEDEDGDDEGDMNASQWISELRRFAPGMQVFELFSLDDYHRILDANNNTLPNGIYVSYYEAMFSNDAREHVPKSGRLDDARLCIECDMPVPEDSVGAHRFTHNIGQELNGIRCISRPTLATRIGHLFDFVGLDEAHKAQKLTSQVTQQIIRLQPRYRYAFTATPIPNLVSDIFPLMGWLAVVGWYRGDRRNAAWPYARGEGHRFNQTFLCAERDITQEAMNRQADPKWRGRCEKISPTVSSPARLLKLITPIMAYISKLDCNPNLPPRIVHDLRVPMAAQQARLYAHYMNRANVPGKDALEKAGKQVAILRDLCARPASSSWNNIESLLVTSQFNPKTAAILSLCAKILSEGRQVLIVCARVGQSSYLYRKLSEAGVRLARIDSELPPDRHSEQANLFKSRRADVMIMGIKCAQAHSFQQCQDLVIGSLEYTYGSFEQAVGRVYRVTTPNAVNVWCVLHQNSIEEIMFDTVATKGDAATICLRGQRVPRDYKPTDIGEILAQNFIKIHQQGALAGLPDESATETEWPGLRKQLQLASESACRPSGKL